jgi:molybdopterin-guanine dinucleotide biosynthesis protein A
MGRDKLLLEVGGVPLLRRVGDTLAGRCAEIVVVGEGGVRLERVRRISDQRRGLGPLAGIEAGLAAARNRLVFIAAGDMPFVPESLVRYLLQLLQSRDVRAVVPRHRERSHPLCAAYDRALLPHVRKALDGRVHAVHEFLQRVHPVEYVEEELWRFGDPDLFLMNVNTPRDLERARVSCGDPA